MSQDYEFLYCARIALDNGHESTDQVDQVDQVEIPRPFSINSVCFQAEDFTIHIVKTALKALPAVSTL